MCIICETMLFFFAIKTACIPKRWCTYSYHFWLRIRVTVAFQLIQTISYVLTNYICIYAWTNFVFFAFLFVLLCFSSSFNENKSACTVDCQSYGWFENNTSFDWCVCVCVFCFSKTNQLIEIHKVILHLFSFLINFKLRSTSM